MLRPLTDHEIIVDKYVTSDFCNDTVDVIMGVLHCESHETCAVA